MKPLHLFSVTCYIRTYAAFYTIDMKAYMSYYVLSQRYECDYVVFINVKIDNNHAALDAVQATQPYP